MSEIETLMEKEVGIMQLRSSVFIQNLDHLGLVAGTIKQLGLIESIDALFGENSRTTKFVSVGECVAAMILNGLGFTNQALYLVSHFFSNKPVDRLLGSHLTSESFNDDALCVALDKIADSDPSQFFANVAFPIAMNRRYRRRFARLDSTTFSLEGAFDGFGGSPEDAPQIISVTHGHSKQHRPDLKQITLSMVNTGPGAIPIWSEPLSGNASDKKTFHETIARVRAFQKAIGDLEEFRWVADSALYSKDQLLNPATDFVWVTRVPETIREAKVMALCLLVYNVAEHEMREALKNHNKTLPNQLKKEINNPTLRWVFKLLGGISVVKMSNDKVVQSAVSNITDLAERIIRLFGHETEILYGLEDSGQQGKVKKNGKK